MTPCHPRSPPTPNSRTWLGLWGALAALPWPPALSLYSVWTHQPVSRPRPTVWGPGRSPLSGLMEAVGAHPRCSTHACQASIAAWSRSHFRWVWPKSPRKEEGRSWWEVTPPWSPETRRDKKTEACRPTGALELKLHCLWLTGETIVLMNKLITNLTLSQRTLHAVQTKPFVFSFCNTVVQHHLLDTSGAAETGFNIKRKGLWSSFIVSFDFCYNYICYNYIIILELFNLLVYNVLKEMHWPKWSI